MKYKIIKFRDTPKHQFKYYIEVWRKGLFKGYWEKFEIEEGNSTRKPEFESYLEAEHYIIDILLKGDNKISCDGNVYSVTYYSYYCM